MENPNGSCVGRQCTGETSFGRKIQGSWVGYPSIYPYPPLDDAEVLKIALNTTRGQEIQKVEEEHQKNFAWEARARRAWPGMAERWTVMDYRYRQNHISNHPVFRVKTWVNHFVHFVSVLTNLNQ